MIIWNYNSSLFQVFIFLLKSLWRIYCIIFIEICWINTICNYNFEMRKGLTNIFLKTIIFLKIIRSNQTFRKEFLIILSTFLIFKNYYQFLQKIILQYFLYNAVSLIYNSVNFSHNERKKGDFIIACLIASFFSTLIFHQEKQIRKKFWFFSVIVSNNDSSLNNS